MKKYCETCKKEFEAQQSNHKYCSDKCRKIGIKNYRKTFQNNYWKTHPKEYADNQKLKRDNNYEARLKVIHHYSNGINHCACCGEFHIEFLEIDHINGGGTQERIKNDIWGNTFIKWLIDNDYPEGYQVICANCNKAKGHKKQKVCPVHHPELYL